MSRRRLGSWPCLRAEEFAPVNLLGRRPAWFPGLLYLLLLRTRGDAEQPSSGSGAYTDGEWSKRSNCSGPQVDRMFWEAQ